MHVLAQIQQILIKKNDKLSIYVTTTYSSIQAKFNTFCRPKIVYHIDFIPPS